MHLPCIHVDSGDFFIVCIHVDSGDTSESSDSEGEDGAALPGQKNPQKRSSLAVLMDNGGGKFFDFWNEVKGI